MNRLPVFLGCLVVLVLILGCKSDLMLPQLEPLEGIYTGTYSYITNYRGGADETITTAHVIFMFDETAYHMNLDTIYKDQHCFCAIDGLWNEDRAVRLQELHKGSNPDSESGCNACNHDENPEGDFDRKFIGDSLILKKQEEGTTTLMMLRLLKIGD